MSNGDVCRTASATPGLFNNQLPFWLKHICCPSLKHLFKVCNFTNHLQKGPQKGLTSVHFRTATLNTYNEGSLAKNTNIE